MIRKLSNIKKKPEKNVIINDSYNKRQFLERYVLRVDLKDSAELQRFILNGRAFHSFGAIKEKARSPYVLRWQRGCTSSSL